VNIQQINEDDARAIEQDSTSGAAVLDKVYKFLGRFVAYPSDHAQVANALWIVHAHLMDLWESTPRLAFLSPEPGSGKTRAMEITELLVPMPVSAVNVSPAYLFRKVGSEDGRPTILYDEIDTVFGPKAKENEEIRGLLNAGHRKGACAGRCVIHGKTVTTEEIPAYCAVALAGLGLLPDTIIQRSIVIRMRRRKGEEQVEPYRRRLHAHQGEAIRQLIHAWAKHQGSQLDHWPEMPPGIQDRDADVWEPLIAIADMVGGEWPTRARAAAVALVAAAKEVDPSLGVQLLGDIRTVFGSDDQLATADLLRKLHELSESPWNDLRGKSLDERGLSKRLKEYGIKPVTIRIGPSTPRGYRRADFLDVWPRYLPAVPATSETTKTSATTPALSVASVADVLELPAKRGVKYVRTGGGEVMAMVSREAAPDAVPPVPCAQCNLDDGQQVRRGDVWLHRECVRFYDGGGNAS
jgi:hypothetical protein